MTVDDEDLCPDNADGEHDFVAKANIEPHTHRCSCGKTAVEVPVFTIADLFKSAE